MPLFPQSVDWAITPTAEGGGGFSVDTADTLCATTVADIDRGVNERVPTRPRRAASAGVRHAVRALESANQRHQHEAVERGAAEQAAAEAEHEADREALRLAALERASDFQADRPPVSKEEWEAHIYSGLCPALDYLFERLAEGGDRYEIMEFFFAGQGFLTPHMRRT